MRYRLTFISGVAVGYVLGARAGRERYEQMRKSARQFAQHPTVQERAKSARDAGRGVAAKAADSVAGKVGGRLPDSVTERVRQLRGRSTDDDWGSSTT
jgi:hypothetical protein